MHPSRAIRGRLTRLLDGRRIVIGISGSIAAIEIPRIARELIRHGAEVQAVMSPEATRLLTTETVTFATGHPPITQLTGDVEHVLWMGPGEGRADLLLIAPATANTIAKMAHGIDDTPVTSFASMALGGGVPILVAPAMHQQLLNNPAVRAALDQLRAWGVGIVSPQSLEGEEKLATPEEVAAAVLNRLARGPWAGRKVVVIGGASRQPIDRVRAITNESSGATAVALARQAHFRGAEVYLWIGAHTVPVPPYLRVEPWGSVEDLGELAHRQDSLLRESAAVLVPAAIADFTLSARTGKISSETTPQLTLELRRTRKVLPELRRLAPHPTRLIGFKLESDLNDVELEARARKLRSEAGLDWVVANDVRTMGSSEISAVVITPRGDRHLIRGNKEEFAGKLLDDIGRELTHERVPLETRRAERARRNAQGRSRRRR
jgi:phosphopantothenoylcysteine decarboxylase/phosphopantothenate--cysteine ligase